MLNEIKHKVLAEAYNFYIKFKRNSMGLKKDRVNQDNGIIYYEGGSDFKESIVLIHGFADSKNGHLMVAKKLLFKYRVFIPDLPGFGDNARNMQDTYSLGYMSEKIIELIHEKNLDKVHILGNSLGGAVAMDIASKAPELVKTLVLVGSAGFYIPTIRTVQNDLLEGKYIFQVKSDREFRTLCDMVFSKAPKIPAFFFSYLSKNFQAQGEWYRKLLDDLIAGSSGNDTHEKLLSDSYNDRAKKFPMNTLVLWGEKDKIFPPEVAKFANAIIPNSQLTILKNAGHAPQHENLIDYIDALLTFLQDNDNNRSLTGKV